MLEREPMDRAVADGELSAFQYDGFWQCMDSKRDLDYLASLYNSEMHPGLGMTYEDTDYRIYWFIGF